MTRSERIQEAIELFQAAIMLNVRVDMNRSKSELMLDLLLAEQKCSEGCDLCKSFHKQMELKPCANGDTSGGLLWMDGGVVVETHGIPRGYVDFKHCPACGRDLTEGESV